MELFGLTITEICVWISMGQRSDLNGAEMFDLNWAGVFHLNRAGVFYLNGTGMFHLNGAGLFDMNGAELYDPGGTWCVDLDGIQYLDLGRREWMNLNEQARLLNDHHERGVIGYWRKIQFPILERSLTDFGKWRYSQSDVCLTTLINIDIVLWNQFRPVCTMMKIVNETGMDQVGQWW